MALISLEFIGFCLLITLIYYICPGKLQNVCLLAANVIFLLPLTHAAGSLLCLFISITSVYFAALFLERMAVGSVRRRVVFHGTLLFNFLLLFTFRYLPFVQEVAGWLSVSANVPDLSSLAPLGISFYTLQLAGYLIQVNDGGLPAEHNFFRLALFGSYFPQLTSGPISRYEDLGVQFQKRRNFDYQKVTFGFQRMVWGFFKKLVISERAAVPANMVFGDYGIYNGFYVVVGVAFFAVQLYCDFSGCMDIVIGMSEVLGIPLADNFQSPFFSRSMAEFWRRWHITLGTWCRDYIFYPLQKTAPFDRIRTVSVRRLGKKRGRKVPMYLAMFLMWFCVGFWHGGLLKYIIGSGLLHFCYIFVEQEGTPLWKRINAFFHINPESGGHIAFQRVRTFLLVCSGFIFFRADSFSAAIHMFSAMTTWNAAVFSLKGFLALGLDLSDLLIFFLSVILLAYVESLQQKGSVRVMIAGQNLVIRWLLFLALLFIVIIFGEYGPGFNSESFIYAQF